VACRNNSSCGGIELGGLVHVGAMIVLQMGRFRLDKQGARTGEVLAPALRHAPLRVRRLA